MAHSLQILALKCSDKAKKYPHTHGLIWPHVVNIKYAKLFCAIHYYCKLAAIFFKNVKPSSNHKP